MAKDVTLHLSKLPMDDDEKLLETLKQMPRKLPTGEGKKQSPGSGEANKLHKRARCCKRLAPSRVSARLKKKRA